MTSIFSYPRAVFRKNPEACCESTQASDGLEWDAV